MPLLKKMLPSSLLESEVNETTAVSRGGKLVSEIADLRKGFKAENFLSSLSFAWEGLIYATKTQRNFRIHLCMATVAVFLAISLQISIFEWALLWGVMGVVLFAELINTALELFVDLLTDGRYDIRAKAIKDMAAGAVFITAVSALACGVCIFIPHVAPLVMKFLS